MRAALACASWLTERRFRTYPRLMAVLFALFFALWLALGEGKIDRTGRIHFPDFLNVQAAAILAQRGEAPSIYDFDRHGKVEDAIAGAEARPHYFGWHYPPTFLLFVFPLASLPYLWAAAVYLAFSFALFWWAMRRIAPWPEAVWPILAFPALWVQLFHGQNAFLVAGLFAAGLYALERRPWLAGILFGLLSFKPQFGLLIPVALIAAGQGRAFAGAALAALLLAFASWLAFGAETWRAFFQESLPATRQILEQGHLAWAKIQSPFAAARLLGGPIALAWAVQGIAALAAAVLVWRLWRGPQPFALKAAALAAAAPFATPYCLDYDLLLLAPALAYFLRDARKRGFLPWEITGIAAIWLAPLLTRSLALGLSLPLGPVAMAGLLFLIWRRRKISA